MRHRVITLAFLLLLVSVGLNAAISPTLSGSWVPAESLNFPRSGAAAVVLSDGRVLIAGGADANGLPQSTTNLLNLDGTVSPGPAMQDARYGHTATLLANGQVLVTGGTDAAGATNSAEIFDPAANRWSMLPAALAAARSGHVALLLPDSTLAIAGGCNAGAGGHRGGL
jgi:N-acetylneuraminic acid mutarotase